jgi:RimJ/RimL family protein N-acetyltransferase
MRSGMLWRSVTNRGRATSDGRGGAWPAPLALTLAGAVVRLEPLAQRHAQGLYDAALPPDIWTWVHDPPAATLPGWLSWFAAALEASARGEEAAFATLDAADASPIGMVRLLALRPADRSIEIGSAWLTPAAWGTGASTEASLLLMGHAFERLGCCRVEFKTHAQNARARAALLGLGTTFEGVHRKQRIVPGIGVRDSAWYSVIDDEWPVVEARLRARLARAQEDSAAAKRG